MPVIKKRIATFLGNYWITITSSAVIFCITLFFFFQTLKWAEDRSKSHFEQRTEQMQGSLERRMGFYIHLLKSGRSFLNNSDTVTRVEWKKFIDDLDVEKDFPGIRGIGFASYVRDKDLEKHIREIRSEGFPDYDVIPPGKREVYSPVIYLEPFDWRNRRAFGFDMFSEPIRRKAMISARDNNQAAVSGRVFLVQETENDTQPGFLIYVPVYEKGADPKTLEERRYLIKGYVYSPFRSGDFMKQIFTDQFQDIDIEVYDGVETRRETLLYNSDNRLECLEKTLPPLHKKKVMYFGGHHWTIFYSPDSSFGFPSDKRLAYSLLLGGIIISLLIFIGMYSISNSRRKEREARMQLSNQNEELVRINNDLDGFIYTASHDLKAPISNIEGLVHAMKDIVEESPPQPSEQKEIISLIESSIARFKSTIQDLTEITKAQKNISEDIEEISLTQIIDDIRGSISNMISESNASFDVDMRECPRIKFSKVNLKSILYNLITNAIKYRSPFRPPLIRIQCKQSDNMLILCVKDNGLGIKASQKEKIFGMFKRLHTHVEGSGIGLYIIKRIIENAGGRIEVESEENKGTLFRIYLPLQPGYLKMRKQGAES